jgi:hypothetical protein
MFRKQDIDSTQLDDFCSPSRLSGFGHREITLFIVKFGVRGLPLLARIGMGTLLFDMVPNGLVLYGYLSSSKRFADTRSNYDT